MEKPTFLAAIERYWEGYEIDNIKTAPLECIPPCEEFPEGYSATVAVVTLTAKDLPKKAARDTHCAYWFETQDGRRGYGDTSTDDNPKVLEAGALSAMEMPRLARNTLKANGAAVQGVAIIINIPKKQDTLFDNDRQTDPTT